MADTPAASITDLLLGLAVAPADQDPNNRFTLEGLTVGATEDGAIELRARKFEAASLHLASGPFLLRVEQLALHALVATVRIEAGKPRLHALEAEGAELTGVNGRAPLLIAPAGDTASAAGWSLAPLATAQGTVRAQIVDAHLLFDADVTVPIQQGGIDFNKTSVEHVGPDSRMGVSRLGLYVDAPNGRSYLYQFPSAPVAGVEYEKRGAMLGPWVTYRGSLQLQAFIEALMRQPRGGQFLGFTDQARLLFDRTAVSGEVQLGDGRFAAPGVQADLAGAGEGRNNVRLNSEAVGRGLAAEIGSLLVRNAMWSSTAMQVHGNELAGKVTVRFSVEDKQVRMAVEIATLKMSGLRLQPASAAAQAL